MLHNTRCRATRAIVCLYALTIAAAAQAEQAETLWVRADQASQLWGPMVLGHAQGVVEQGALGDFLVSAHYLSEDHPRSGYAEYSVDIVRRARYYVWARLRYPSGIAESFALVPQTSQADQLPHYALGGSGPSTAPWHWHSQGSGPQSPAGSGRLAIDLTPGRFVFRIYAREAGESVYMPHKWAMGRVMFNPRLNLLCLTTDPQYVPSDAAAQAALGLSPSGDRAEELRVRDPVLPRLTSADWQRMGKQPVPDWLRCPRFFTKDSWREEIARRRPGDIAEFVRQVAANEGNALRLSVYWGGETYYPSKVAPHVPGLGRLDYLREAIDEGRRTGVRIVAYLNPNALYEGHPLFPQALVRTADGAVQRAAYAVRDARFACINHPAYRQMLQDLLKEIFADYGADGLYVDGLTPHYCFCPHCRTAYEAMWHEPMPVESLKSLVTGTVLWEMVSKPEPPGDPSDPAMAKYAQFLARSLTHITRIFTETVKRCRPDAVTLYHSWPKPETLPYYDGTLTEIYLKQPWRFGLWKSGELANYSNIFPVPVLFNIYLHDRGTPGEARIKSVQGLANGCYPNFWNLLAMRPTFRFLRENAEYLDFARTRPVHGVAFPRSVRADHVARRLVPKGVPRSQAGNWPLEPYVGMYSALARRGLPVTTLQRSDFHTQLNGFAVLCLANEAAMSDEQAEAVRRFVAGGGGLVATYATSRFDQAGCAREDFALADLFGASFQAAMAGAPRQIVASQSHPVAAQLPHDAPLAYSEPHVETIVTTGQAVAMLVDSSGRQVPAAIVHQFGAGRVVFLPGRLDALLCRELSQSAERFLAAAVAWAAGDRLPVHIEAQSPVSVTLFEQPGRRILHLVNLQGDPLLKSDEIKTVDSLRVALRLPESKRLNSLGQLWRPRAIPFTVKDRTASFSLAGLELYEVVVAEVE